MRLKTTCVSVPIALLVFVLSSTLVSAQTAVINFTDRGWYDLNGYHGSDLKNYIVGDNRGTSCGLCENDFRDFFVFDLSSVTQSIASAKLALFNPSSPPIAGYISADPSETYELHDVTTATATLRADHNNSVATWNDLGTGVVYGSRNMTSLDQGDYVEITLNSAAIAANAAS
jgi:hypothetical protein